MTDIRTKHPQLRSCEVLEESGGTISGEYRRPLAVGTESCSYLYKHGILAAIRAVKISIVFPRFRVAVITQAAKMKSSTNDVAPTGGFSLIFKNPYLLGVASVSRPREAPDAQHCIPWRMAPNQLMTCPL